MFKLKTTFIRFLVVVSAMAGVIGSTPSAAQAEQPWAARSGKWTEEN